MWDTLAGPFFSVEKKYADKKAAFREKCVCELDQRPAVLESPLLGDVGFPDLQVLP